MTEHMWGLNITPGEPTSYTYHIYTVERVVDGDTYWIRLDVGLRAVVLIEIRGLGYDTPEMHRNGPWEGSVAQMAKEAAIQWLADNPDAIVTTRKHPTRNDETDSLGRWLATITDRNGQTLGEYLISKNLAVPSPEGKDKWNMTWNKDNWKLG